MKNVSVAAVVAALSVAGGIAQAGGFAPVAAVVPVAPPPAVIVPPAALPLSGALWLDAGKFSYEQDDGEVEGDGNALRFGGMVEANVLGVTVGVDAQSIRRSFDVEEGDENDVLHSNAPEVARAFGLHLGRDFGMAHVGAFAGINQYSGIDYDTDQDSVESGNLYGLEAEFAVTPSIAIFGQAGMADMVSDDDGDPDDPDNFFDGNFYRIGASADLGRLGFAVETERGHSDGGFSDGEGEEGDYAAYGVRVDFALTRRLTLNASYDRMEIETDQEDEGDVGEESTMWFGVTYAFGGTTGRPNLTTPYRPGLAAAWAETLD